MNYGDILYLDKESYIEWQNPSGKEVLLCPVGKC